MKKLCHLYNNILIVSILLIVFGPPDSPWNHTLDVYGSNLKEHQSVTVSCSAFTPCVHSPPELTWNLKRDSIRQILTNTDGNITTKIQENITLTYRHDGYKINCSARYPVTGGFKQSPESVKTLSVSHSPKETRASISPSGLVSVGTLLELSCSSRAKPPISRFSWFKNSKDGVTKVSEVQVHRFTATPTDEGDYYCEVTNSLGSETSRSVCVDIFDAPFIPSINIPVGELKEDQSITITCSVSTPCPQSQPGLTWNLKQDSLRQTEKNTEGTFTTKIQETITLSDKHDGYIISCSARHPGDKKGKTAKTEVTLTVSYAPKNTSASISPSSLLSEGNWVELICSSRANPPSRFSWFKKGPEKFSKISTGIILRVKFTGGNEYYCEAENELGKQRSSPITFRSQGTTGSLIYVLLGVVGMAALGIIGFVLNKWYKQTS
ncbi:vascular cell adhesion protein 1-like isoform X2 [Poeciliopsis prolifica]|uniref:vascular cell adhesion protein 1-like isoform X2 n=1 Tax=Poeciliopsis prolifica TaxID=188132 RepID=UPI0024137B39|nr:vascular cell adhesion protein 1-like isoform X2 [Poeciliopsis prolifica]